MNRIQMSGAALAGVLLFGAGSASAISVAAPSVITHVALPGQVPDEQPPRVNIGDAPTGWGPDSWQGPTTGKSNWHARYNADGDYLSTIFPADAASLTISNLASISYFTKTGTAIPTGQDWWIQIYTRPDGVNDARSWYGYKFTNNYNNHAHTGTWQQWSTDTGMTFNLDGSATELSMNDLASNYGNELVEMISVQTDSGWNGFDGYVDGLQITLTNGNVGRVNFEGSQRSVPEPSVLWLLGAGMLVAVSRGLRKRAG